MSKEVAAAILTRIYFEHTPDARKQFRAPAKDEGRVSPASGEEIGHVYGYFLTKLDLFAQGAKSASAS